MTAKKKSAGNKELTAKEAELEKLRATGRPIAFVLVALALVTMLSALAGSAIGLPRGLHLFTGPAMVVLVLVRLPRNRRMGALMKEIEELKKAT